MSSPDETIPDEALERGEDTRALAPGARVGRYVVLERLGAGAMGVVFSAWDPELDRRLALKLLHAGASAREGTAQLRLVREAQALARLSHPNVVAVHDVGTFEGQVFVAMEYVEGRTLRAWARQEPRAWARIVEVLEHAGRGLAAAHTVGLVHRDFKPDNVMIADDGRVRVMDFGLARIELDEDDRGDSTSGVGASGVGASGAVLRSPATRLVESSTASLDSTITRAGALLGTPAYMAPEQFAGRRGDARSDQFSFCVAAWELLYGERPFASDNLAQLIDAAAHGRLREPPRDSPVPARIRKLLARGLAAEPAARWPDLDALLESLAAPPRRRSPAWAFVVVALVAGIAALVLEREDAPTCPVATELDAVWTDARAEQLRAGLAAVERDYADATAERVALGLDAWAEQWRAAKRDACEATHVRREQSAELLDRRNACLDARRDSFVGLLDMFTRELDPGAPRDAAVIVARNAMQAVDELPRLEPCSDPAWLAAEVPPPEDPAVAGHVEQLRGELGRIDALTYTGEFERALGLLDELDQAVAAVEYPPLTIERDRVRARFVLADGRDDEGVELLEQVYFAARAHSLDHLAADAAVDLVDSNGSGRVDIDAARRWARHADAELRRTGDEPIVRVRLRSALGAAETRAGEYAVALRELEAAVALLESVGDPPVVLRAKLLRNLGYTRFVSGDHASAKSTYERSIAAHEAALGESHPDLGKVLDNYGWCLSTIGEAEAARAVFERSLRIREAALGDDHPDLGDSHSNLAIALLGLGDYQAAIAHGEQALARYLAVLEPDHPNIGNVHNNLGIAYHAVEDFDRAIDHYDRARSSFEHKWGPDHPYVAYALGNYGRALIDAGRIDEAAAPLERALAISEAKLGPDNIDTALPLVGLAMVARARGRFAEAVAHARRAVGLREAHDAATYDLAEARFELARALVGSGGSGARAEALELTRSARAGYVEDPRGAELLPEVEALLAELDGPN